MPQYDFTCEDPASPYHEQPVTMLMSVTEYEATKDTLTCPVTKKPLKRIYSGKTGFVFKGSGFHATDYVLKNH